VIIRARIANDLRIYPSAASGRPLPSWSQLDKQRPGLIRRYAAEVEPTRLARAADNLLVLQPTDLDPIASGRHLEEALIGLVRRYRLDSADAAILLEARRAGIDSIASEDPEWQRAARDFDVYTWR
jgi:predicted nucleic acid-binding protein